MILALVYPGCSFCLVFSFSESDEASMAMPIKNDNTNIG